MSRKILFQVVAPAVLVGLLLVGTCLVSAWSIHRLQNNLARILRQNVASLQAALELENQMRQLRYHTLLYFNQPTPALLQEIKQDEQMFEDALADARRSANTDEELAYVRQIESGYQRYRTEMAHEMADIRAGKSPPVRPPADFQRLAENHPIRRVVEPCQALWHSSHKNLEESAEASRRVSDQARIWLLLLGLAGPIGGVLCGYGIVRGLTRSISQLSVRVRDVVHRLDGSLPAAPPGMGEGEKGRKGEGEKDGDSVSPSPPLPISPSIAPGPAPGLAVSLPGGSDERDAVIDVATVEVAADADLAAIDRQLQHVVRRVEEVMERLQRHHWEMLRSEQLAAVGRLAAGVAHEVRNPLTGMKLLVEAALRSHNRKPLSDEDLAVIHGEIVRMEDTVQNFLAFARLPALQRQVTDLRESIGRPVELVRARARQQDVEVVTRLPDRPLPVNLDAAQFGTVLLNLFLNALDAMPQGGQLLVELEPEGRLCRLRVCDTGPGIAPEIIDRLFTPFASTKPTGTGLGLSLSRRIVEEHAGKIGAANRAEGGACFLITLPLADAEPPPAPAASTQPIAAGGR